MPRKDGWKRRHWKPGGLTQIVRVPPPPSPPSSPGPVLCVACAPSWNGEGKNAGAAVPALVLRADEYACNPHMVFLISLSPSIPVSLRACIPRIHSHVPFPSSFFFVMLCEPVCHRSILDLPRCLPCLHSLFGYDILNGRLLSFFFLGRGVKGVGAGRWGGGGEGS